ncbi:hypothetical protein [Paraburkholderia sp. Ac-20347]|uniref:hypothetical protein n=1 Tax=Paraburkholderia sp. Ac-20347 TaxID=2703892 RepID=UPI00197DC2A5|nr:hypothetical protein [Paraburkholderia sp. Ac-20347]MBN3811098.1 hypothetical protein [Paraburkholderia sp. Ac-20347]
MLHILLEPKFYTVNMPHRKIQYSANVCALISRRFFLLFIHAGSVKSHALRIRLPGAQTHIVPLRELGIVKATVRVICPFIEMENRKYECESIVGEGKAYGRVRDFGLYRVDRVRVVVTRIERRE